MLSSHCITNEKMGADNLSSAAIPHNINYGVAVCYMWMWFRWPRMQTNMPDALFSFSLLSYDSYSHMVCCFVIKFYFAPQSSSTITRYSS